MSFFNQKLEIIFKFSRDIFLLLLTTSTLPQNSAENLEMECGFIEMTDRGLTCEFNNIFTFDTSNVNIIERNASIEAVIFRQSELYNLPKDIFTKFPYLKHVDVELTQLKVIEADNFRSANELKYFLARFNDVTILRGGLFLMAPKLKFIVLQYNKIRSIHPQAFQGLKYLEALYLDYNQIHFLPSRILDGTPNLLHLSISFNNLTEIPSDLFTTTKQLETLNLGHNSLTHFNDSIFDYLPNLERLQLENNDLKKLDLVACKSTEINVQNNDLEAIELNKWTRTIQASGNPVKKLILHEHYGAGRSYNFSFTYVNEIVFFVHEHCCSVENLENFNILMSSFGDLSEKNLNPSDWMCIFMKNVAYETPNGFVVNDVCTKINNVVTATSRNREEFYQSTRGYVAEETTRGKKSYNDYDEVSTTESNFIVSYQDFSTTEESADVEEFYPVTTQKTSFWKSVKLTAKEWKSKVSDSWKGVKNKTKEWWMG